MEGRYVPPQFRKAPPPGVEPLFDSQPGATEHMHGMGEGYVPPQSRKASPGFVLSVDPHTGASEHAYPQMVRKTNPPTSVEEGEFEAGDIRALPTESDSFVMATTEDHSPEETGARSTSSVVLQSTIGLSPGDIPALQRHQQNRNFSLHAEARQLLNRYADGEELGSTDITNTWGTWRLYIACHKSSLEIVGAGIASVSVEWIPNTRDSNRGNAKRVDFVFHRVDGSAVRLHPGRTPRADAQIVQVPAVLQSTPIHTDFETLRAIPQSDRTSKMRAYEILHALRSEYQAITFSTYGLTDDYIFDLTSEEHFAWKPLFANLASVLEITKDNQIINVSLVLQSTEHITVEISFVQAPDRPRRLHLVPRHFEGILREVKAIVE